MKYSVFVGLLGCLACLPIRPAAAQDHLKVSGLAYLDYAYVLASPVADEEGENGFGYRRLYLTTDFKLSDTFSGRARLEAKDSDTTPFVKDLYLVWKDVWGEGHDLVAGISPPPTFTVSEKFWDYRSLEKTIMDRTGVVSSRDFGLAARGRLAADGSLRYGLMVANNNSVRAEDDRYKRVYGQLEWGPTEALTLTLGGDYAGYGDERDHAYTVNAFAGYKAAAFRVGAEGFFHQIGLADTDASNDLLGVSIFAAARLAEAWEAVARIDRAERDLAGSETGETFLLAGLAYRPHDDVRIMPNVLVSKERTDDEALVTGRVTLHIDF